jgi:hypothetical protein
VALGVDSASNRNEYQEYFLGVKAAVGVTTLHVLIVLKSGRLNLLGPLGPLQACNGIALPLPLLFLIFNDNMDTYKKKKHKENPVQAIFI